MRRAVLFGFLATVTGAQACDPPWGEAQEIRAARYATPAGEGRRAEGPAGKWELVFELRAKDSVQRLTRTLWLE